LIEDQTILKSSFFQPFRKPFNYPGVLIFALKQKLLYIYLLYGK